MKKIVLLALLLLGNYGFSQEDYLFKLDDAKKTIDFNKASFLYTSSKREKKTIYSVRVLNQLFDDMINGVFLASSDVSTQRYNANLSNEDNEFSFNYNLNFQKDEYLKKTYIISLGLNSKSKNQFATLYKNSDISNDLALNIKTSIIGHGFIFFEDKQLQKSLNYSTNYLDQKYYMKLKEYENGDEIKLDIIKDSLTNDAFGNSAKSKERLIEEKKAELEDEYYPEHAKAIIDNKWFNALWNHSLTAEFKLPFTPSVYTSADSIQTIQTRETKFMPWKLSLNYTNMWYFRNKSKLYFFVRGKVFNQNNIESETLSSADFLSFINQGPNNQAVSESNTVYIGEFKDFIAKSLSAEISYYPKQGYFGLSASIEQTFGEQNFTNWKVGVPFILKDKDGEQTINLELLYKEENKTRFFGLRVGLPLGNYIN